MEQDLALSGALWCRIICFCYHLLFSFTRLLCCVLFVIFLYQWYRIQVQQVHCGAASYVFVIICDFLLLVFLFVFCFCFIFLYHLYRIQLQQVHCGAASFVSILQVIGLPCPAISRLILASSSSSSTSPSSIYYQYHQHYQHIIINHQQQMLLFCCRFARCCDAPRLSLSHCGLIYSISKGEKNNQSQESRFANKKQPFRPRQLP